MTGVVDLYLDGIRIPQLPHRVDCYGQFATDLCARNMRVIGQHRCVIATWTVPNVQLALACTFARQTSQPASDSNTVLLFYFDEAPVAPMPLIRAVTANNAPGALVPVRRSRFHVRSAAYPSPPPEAAAVADSADTI